MDMSVRQRKHQNNAPDCIDQSSPSKKKEDRPAVPASVDRMSKLFGFSWSDVSSWKRFVRLAYRPMDPSSLGITRALFGLMMILDVTEERGLADADVRWGNPFECRFPLFDALQPLPLQWMCMVYLAMWLGALGIALGLYYRISCLAFVLSYWYIFLLDKSSWNNHSYLFGLVALLFSGTSANHYWSVDGWVGRVTPDSHVPLWNYAILRFQFFALYFLAGLKKLDRDWIQGYSMSQLHNHWVFLPFKLVLTGEQVDYWIIHLNGFFLDLTVGFWMFFDRTRPVAFVFCAAFHLMNSRLFTIGMFPYVCLVTMPLFCHADWPRRLGAALSKAIACLSWPRRKASSAGLHVKEVAIAESNSCIYPKSQLTAVGWRHQLVVALLLSHVGLQAFLPYSHFITKGYNNWTNGLYGYSWDMMVHTWNTVLVVVKVVDHNTGKEHFLDPEAWVETDKWSKHGDMMSQYARCLRRNLARQRRIAGGLTSDNISIHFDVWCSLNGRFQQRMYDPRVDVLAADWSPWKRVSWLMPLITEFSTWRQRIAVLESQVFSWSNHSEALFVADFPGLSLDNYISPDLSNVTLTLLSGGVTVEQSDPPARLTLREGESATIASGTYHSVRTTSVEPSCYMYTFVNSTDAGEPGAGDQGAGGGAWDALRREVGFRCENFARAVALVSNAVLNILHGVPMVKRVRVG